mmetsp:Transcript_20390/g.29874  ORF Transcript_20390/g.29874 Transcript_20390/m.29874 type:complete len:126 (-) Transcript_20390:938-1315(-)
MSYDVEQTVKYLRHKIYYDRSRPTLSSIANDAAMPVGRVSPRSSESQSPPQFSNPSTKLCMESVMPFFSSFFSASSAVPSTPQFTLSGNEFWLTSDIIDLRQICEALEDEIASEKSAAWSKLFDE